MGRCDIGAYEYIAPGLPGTLYTFGGTPQHAAPSKAYLLPLQAAVLDSAGTPVSNTIILFSAPANGASGIFVDTGICTTTVATTEAGIAAAPTFTANGLSGTFTVTAVASEIVDPVHFRLDNLAWYVATDGSNGASCISPGEACATIDGAQSKPDIGLTVGDTILVAGGTYTGTGDQVVVLSKNVTLSGGWNGTFTIQGETSIIDGQNKRGGIMVNSGVTAFIEYFTIRRGTNSGVYNLGTLTINKSIVDGNTNSGRGGGGIYNKGVLTVNSSQVSNNTMMSSGGGIANACCLSAMIINNSTVNGNTANSGGGIASDGVLAINNSTISGNTATSSYGGGMVAGRSATLNNSTVSNNNFGGIAANAPVTLSNSILAGNKNLFTPDCWGNLASGGYNLIGSTIGCRVTSGTGDLLNVNPSLFPLTDSPGYHRLLRGSPAIDAGNPSGCTDHEGNLVSTDQRGAARVGRCDIGAYEYDPDNDPLAYIFLPAILRK